MKGSSNDTNPSLTGRSVLLALWAMLAEPMPASLLKLALRKPIIITPMNPPFIASGWNAPFHICANASPMCEMFAPIIKSENST